MGQPYTTYALYGVRIDDDSDWEALEKDPGVCRDNGLVGCFRAGKHYRRMLFLAHQCFEVEIGQYHLMTRDRIFEERKFQRTWDDQLMSAVMRLGLHILDGPGWFLVPHEE